MEKPDQQFQLKWKAVAIVMVMVCASVLCTAYAIGSGPGGNSIPVVIESGSGVETASYIIYKDGDYNCLKNGTTGRIILRESSASLVFQTAIDACNVSRGGYVHVTTGNYSIDTQIEMRRNVSLRGSGLNTVLYAEAAMESVINWDNTSHRNTLSGFKIDCNNKSNHGLNQTNVSYTTVEDVNVWWAADDGIYITDGVDNVYRNVVTRNSTGDGLSWNKVVAGTTLRLDNVYALWNAERGFYMDNVLMPVMTMCIAEANTKAGVYMNYVNGASVDGLWVENNNAANGDSSQLYYSGAYSSFSSMRILGGASNYGLRMANARYSVFDSFSTTGASRAIYLTSSCFQVSLSNYYVVSGDVIDESPGDSDYVQSVMYNVSMATGSFCRTGQDLSAATPIVYTIDKQPDCPRTIRWAITHSQITAFTLVIVGIDANGVSHTETFTQASGWNGETAYAYLKITSVTMTTRTGTGAGDTGTIGVGDSFGVPGYLPAVTSIILMTKNGAPTTAFTFNAVYQKIAVTAATVSGDDYVIYYKWNHNFDSWKGI